MMATAMGCGMATKAKALFPKPPKRGRIAAVGGRLRKVNLVGGPFDGQPFFTRIGDDCYTLVIKDQDGKPGRYKINHGFKHKGIWEDV